MKKHNKLYLGRAGQLFVVSEFLLRYWNAAIPEIDTGVDVFVVKDSVGDFQRVQVKAITGKKTSYGFSAKFILPFSQLQSLFTPELVYFLVVRLNDNWETYLIIRRAVLDEYCQINKIGTINKKTDTVQLYFSFKKDKIICSKKDNFKDHEKDWSIFGLK